VNLAVLVNVNFNEERNMKKRTIISIIGSILLIGLIATGIYLYQSGVIFPKAEQVQQKTTDNTPDSKEVTYKGKDDITALALLKQNAKIETSGTGEMAFVTSINGVSADSTKNEYWAFDVNGQPATVGAGSYVTKDSDTIVWKLSSF
jgi:uncharacterized membrane protein YkgB